MIYLLNVSKTENLYPYGYIIKYTKIIFNIYIFCSQIRNKKEPSYLQVPFCMIKSMPKGGVVWSNTYF